MFQIIDDEADIHSVLVKKFKGMLIYFTIIFVFYDVS